MGATSCRNMCFSAHEPEANTFEYQHAGSYREDQQYNVKLYAGSHFAPPSNSQIDKQKSISKSYAKASTIMEEEDKQRIKDDIRRERMVEIGEAIPDIYDNLQQIREGLRRNGLEKCRLILGIDFTASNNETGKYAFEGRCLHEVRPDELNLYQQVMEIMTQTLQTFSTDGKIPAYYFGDLETRDISVSPLNIDVEGKEQCDSLEHLLGRYTEIIPHVKLAGPTSFVPLIKKAIQIVKERQEFHILVIIGDGAVSHLDENIAAVKEAANYPLAIIMVGVGDGDFYRFPDDPWCGMKELDDMVRGRKFDNFQFVQYEPPISAEEFAKECLMEVPLQFKQCQELNYRV